MQAALMLASEGLSRLAEDKELRIRKWDDTSLYQFQLDGNYEAVPSSSTASGMTNPASSMRRWLRYSRPAIWSFSAARDEEAMATLRQLASPERDSPEFAIQPRKIVIWTDEGWAIYQA